jgi:ABC-type nitrate/sulfonate/bicarbonate transport system permease component
MNVLGSARLHRVGVLGGLLLLWEVVAAGQLLGVSDQHFPRFSTVALAFWRMLADGELTMAVLETLRAYAQGFVLAVVVGVVGGVALGRLRFLARALMPTIEFLRPMPSVALIPIAVLFLGIGEEMQRLVAMYAAVWPVLLGTMYGVRGVDPILLQTARQFGLSRRRTLFKIVLPGASPYIATGIRLASLITLSLIITTELMASGNGLGNVIVEYQLAFKAAEAYAGIVMVVILGYANFLVTSQIERRVMRWHNRLSAMKANR